MGSNPPLCADTGTRLRQIEFEMLTPPNIAATLT